MRPFPNDRPLTWAALAAAAALCLPVAAAHAGEIYVQGGFAGAGVGFAQPLADGFTLRADVMGTGTRGGNYNIDGTEYRGQLKLNRAALFGDWFVTGGGFRLTAGLGAHDATLELTTTGAGQVVNIGSRTLVLTAGDRFEAKVEYPTVMPYLGVGYGHHGSAAGWGFVFDAGVFIGRAKVTGRAVGAGFTAAGVTQADVDAELQQIRDDNTDLKVLPQVTFGANYRF